MDYSFQLKLIEDIDVKIRQKQNELDGLNAVEVKCIVHNTMARNLESEIRELMVQRTYYSNYLSDQLMSRCIGGCCKRSYF